MEQLGFEKDKRICRKYGNEPQNVIIDGRHCKFKSKLEYRWALYLEMLKRHDYIIEWEYEPLTFYFPDEKTAPVQYTPDFRVTDCKEIYWQECKGMHDGSTNTKFRRMAEHNPDIIMELVLMSLPKKTANRRRVANKYVRRIIDAGRIFRQCGIK